MPVQLDSSVVLTAVSVPPGHKNVLMQFKILKSANSTSSVQTQQCITYCSKVTVTNLNVLIVLMEVLACVFV